MIIFRDANEVNTWFEAIGVIEHRGSISKLNTSRGHYVCDIKQNGSNLWYRTNDDRKPFEINTESVSRQGYAILFRRVVHD